MIDENNLIQSAIDALKKKDKITARNILTEILKNNPNNDEAWTCFAYVSQSRQQALSCLKKAITINPANDQAWKLINKLENENVNNKSNEKDKPEIKQNTNQKKTKSTIYGCLGVILFIFIIFVICIQTSTNNIVKPVDQTNIEYRVKGSSFSLTYNNSQDNTEQIGEYNGDWSYKFSPTSHFFHAYVSAQNQNDYGTITAEIWVNGILKETSTSQGAYVIASASCMIN